MTVTDGRPTRLVWSVPVPGRIEVTGHRGAMAHAPENTALSLVTAEQLGVDEIELDVRVSADGVALISHDDDLSRVLGVDLAPWVSGTRWADLQRLRLPRGQRLLSLPEALELTTSDLQIELKTPEAAATVARVLAEYPDEQRRCTLTSFNSTCLVLIRELMPSVPRGLVAEAYDPALCARAEAVQATWIYCGWSGLTAGVVADLHTKRFKVGAWLLRTVQDAELACRLGVDKVTADAPGRAREWLEAIGEGAVDRIRG